MKLLLFAALFLYTNIWSTQNVVAKIDKDLGDCIRQKKYDKNIGESQCYDIAIENWEKRLDEVYKNLEEKLEASKKNILKESQLRWISYKEMEFKMIDEIYNKSGLEVLKVKKEFIKHRVLKLRSYLNSL